MRVFKPIWESQSRRRIERYIEHPKSEDVLAMIAISCDFPDLRSKACAQLTQPEKLKYVADTTLDFADLPTFLAAVCRTCDFEDLTVYHEITDKIGKDILLYAIANALSEKAEKNPAECLAEQLLERIADENVLARFAFEGKALSLKAVQRIRSKELLQRIGKELLHNDPLEVVPYCALQIGDIELLAQCALTDSCDSPEWRKKYEAVMQDPRYSEIAAKFLETKE
jgi:hypothetical protein